MERPLYYDRDGNPMTRLEWAESLDADVSERTVKQETLPNGLRVSTVWIGSVRSDVDELPMVFETLVFPPKNHQGERHPCQADGARYPTEGAAIAGHDQIAAKWRDWHRGHRP